MHAKLVGGEVSSQDNDRLKQDHAELDGLLRQLNAALESNDVTRIYATLDLFWARLAMHIRAEHLHLFETILQAVNRKRGALGDDTPPIEEAEKTIEQLREDHNFFMLELSRAVAVVRGLLANPEADVTEPLQNVRKGVHAVQQRLIKHNEIEENGVYLWTRTLLSEEEQSELAALVQKELENTPPRFSATANEP
jgi:hemerythrin-like domain-containing protein